HLRLRSQQGRHWLLCLQEALGLRARASVLRTSPAPPGQGAGDQPLESEIWPHGRSLEAVAAAACQRGWAADRPGAGIVAYTPQMERSDEATADGAAPHR